MPKGVYDRAKARKKAANGAGLTKTGAPRKKPGPKPGSKRTTKAAVEAEIHVKAPVTAPASRNGFQTLTDYWKSLLEGMEKYRAAQVPVPSVLIDELKETTEALAQYRQKYFPVEKPEAPAQLTPPAPLPPQPPQQEAPAMPFNPPMPPSAN
jgi:threonyl-tRNA synthetase